MNQKKAGSKTNKTVSNRVGKGTASSDCKPGSCGKAEPEKE